MMWPMHHPGPSPLPGCCLPQAGWPVFPVVFIPVACASPHPPAPCAAADDCGEVTVPQQIDATGVQTSTGMTGGEAEARLTLEYLVETGAAVLTVKVTAVQPDGVTSTWGDSGITVGFHVQEKFLTVQPGSKLTLEVGDPKVTARLRWCETICC